MNVKWAAVEAPLQGKCQDSQLFLFIVKKKTIVTATCCEILIFDLQDLVFFLKKWAYPGLFFIYSRPFKHTLQFLQQINVKKYLSSIRYRDSNPRPLGRESLPITTRPGLSLISTDKCVVSFYAKSRLSFCGFEVGNKINETFMV